MKQKDTYHHGDLRQALIDEALAWINSEGISSLSLRGIARRVGVSHNAPYRHFEDKEALLAVVAEEGFQALTEALKGLQPLEAIGVAYVNFAMKHSARYRVMFGFYQRDEQKYPSLAKAATEAFMVLVEAIKEGQAAGAIRPGDPKELANVAWALVHGLSMLLIDGQIGGAGTNRVEELADFTTRILSEGLGLKK